MNVARAGAGCAAAAAFAALAAAPASLGFSAAPAVKLYREAPASVVLLHTVTKKKDVHSCNKGDNRKNHAKAALDAWAVACEFPPRSEPNTEGLQSITAAAAAAQAG